MRQAKFSVKEAQAHFLNNFKAYGFKDKSSMLRTAIAHFKNNLELENLRKSAKELTETAVTGWPE